MKRFTIISRRWVALLILLGSYQALAVTPPERNSPEMKPAEMNSGSASVSWGEPLRGLRLGVATDGSEVELHLQNVGTTPLEVLSHVKAGEVHLDWYKLRLEDEKSNSRELRLMDNRNRSAIVQAHLEPGASIQHQVDIVAWAARSVNGAQPLDVATYKLYAVYQVEPESDHWNGRLEAGSVVLIVSSTEVPTRQSPPN